MPRKPWDHRQMQGQRTMAQGRLSRTTCRLGSLPSSGAELDGGMFASTILTVYTLCGGRGTIVPCRGLLVCHEVRGSIRWNSKSAAGRPCAPYLSSQWHSTIRPARVPNVVPFWMLEIELPTLPLSAAFCNRLGTNAEGTTTISN
jgi:hypothetical protein